jgi:choline monooxygenase
MSASAGFDPTLAIERARTPPAAWYRSPATLQVERDTVFARHWQCAARVHDLAAMGAFVAGALGDDPFVVVRDVERSLRAFANVCRHNGTAIAQGCGQVDALTCPYHGWRYGLDGRLLSAPRTAGLADFDRAEFSLIPMGLHTFGPLVMVHPEGPKDAPDWGPLHARLETTQWRDQAFHGSRSYHLDCNWKVPVDNYLDGGYHVGAVHPALAAQLDTGAYRTELFDTFSIQSVPAAADAGERLSGEALYAWVYPNLMINRYGPMLDINVVHPTGPETCRVDFDWYFASDCEPAFIEQSLEASDRVQQEDMAICASVQRGMASRHFRPGPYAPHVEMGKHHFHRLLARDLEAGDTA